MISRVGQVIFDSGIMLVATSFFVLYSTGRFSNKAYCYNRILLNRVKLHIKQVTPKKVQATALKVQSFFLKRYFWLLNNFAEINVILSFTKYVLQRFRFEQMRRLGRMIEYPIFFFKAGHLLESLFRYFNNMLIAMLTINTTISSFFQNFLDQSDLEKRVTAKKIFYSVWRQNAGYIEESSTAT